MNDDPGHTIADEASKLWDVDEADRFAMLAISYPEMLTHDEQVVWKLVRENAFIWKGINIDDKWSWIVKTENISLERLREHWSKFIAVARGEADKSLLPQGLKIEAEEPQFDDEIPF